MNKGAQKIKRLMADPMTFCKYAVFTMDPADKKHYGAKRMPVREKAYLQDIVNLWKYAESYEGHIIIEKSRQLMVSWIFAALHLYEAATTPNRDILLISKTEDKAIELLKRIKYIYEQIPEDIWPKHLRPKMDAKQKALTFEFPSGNTSVVRSLTSNEDAARSLTASRIFFDEFAFMDDVDELYQGAMGSAAGGGSVVIVSTNPKLKAESDCLFWRIRDDRLEGAIPNQKPFEGFTLKSTKGFKVHKNSNGFLSVALHYSADPDRDPDTETGRAWYDRNRPNYDKRRWDTEMELSRSTYGGEGVFSDDFSTNNHVKDALIQPKEGTPILRGWDFAGNHSIVFCQYINERLYVLAELPNIGWHTRDVVPKVEEYSERNYPGFKFIDLVDPSGFDRGRNDVDGESNVDRMVTMGIDRRQIVKLPTNRQEPRHDAVLKMLTKMKSGDPCFVVSSQCHMIIRGLSGAYQFAAKIHANQSKPSVVKNEYSHIIDALQYVCLFVATGRSDHYLRANRYAHLRRQNGVKKPIYQL